MTLNEDTSRRDVLEALTAIGAFGAGVAIGDRFSADDAWLGGGGGPVDEPSFEVEATRDATVYYAPTVDDLAQPNDIPSICIVGNAGVLLATGSGDAFADYPLLSDTSMTEVKSIQIATSVDELAEPDEKPALAVTAESGVLFMGGGDE